jgi:bifunctional UDP-N-acetylglucosamine pyrophosphorylase/glucosamine-1-phosphate N-acetyltransferase
VRVIAASTRASVDADRRPLAVVVLAGGQGKRLRLEGPKVLASLCGVPSLGHVLAAARSLEPEKIVVVACHRKELVAEYLKGWPGVEWVDQGEPRGTGHAVLAAGAKLGKFAGDVLVLFGDGPLVRGETLARLLAGHRSGGEACTLAFAKLGDPTGYGRIVRAADGTLDRVVEERDADAATRAIGEVHCGIAFFRAAELFRALREVGSDNAAGEQYLTDAYRLLQEAGGKVTLQPLADPDEALGFNTPAELLEIRRRMRRRILERHQSAGVEIEDPDTVRVDADVTIGAGTKLLSFVVIRSGVVIGRGCEVGPFSHLRGGTVLEDGAEVGNFVEVKKSRLGARVKAKHLTYLGDATIGRDTNVGAGTITANWDGKQKHPTQVGARVFLGSGTVLIAPVKVGEGATTGAGSVVTRGRDVAPGATVIGVPARPHEPARRPAPPARAAAPPRSKSRPRTTEKKR